MSSKKLVDTLKLQDFYALKSELERLRVDTVNKSSILAFVRGLRLSARLIYALRTNLSGTGYDIDWGHLISPDGDSCSPECDIIIYKNGFESRWNGTDKPVMDFKFINCDKAVAVISCKSLIDSVDKKYVQEMKKYVDKVLLFAECCEPKKISRIKDAATKNGYIGFWYLYEFNKDTKECKHDDNVLIDFLAATRKLVEERK